MKENDRRAAFRKGLRRGGRSRQGLDFRQIIKIVTSAVRCVVWCLLNAILSLWDLNPVSVVIRRWRKSQPKQASIALTVRPRFRDLIGDWFLSYEGRKRKLLQWVHSMLPWLSEDVMDFGPSWQDGIVLCALMETLNPGSCTQVHLLKPHHRVNNCRLGIQLAMTYLEINQATLSPEEMSLAEEGTEVKLVQMVQLVRWHFVKQGSKPKVESHTGSEEPVVPFKCEARGTGIKAGIVGKRTKFNLFVESVKYLHLSIEIKGPNNEYNKETIISMHSRGSSKLSRQSVALTNLEDEAKAKVVEDGEGHSFLRQKSFDEGPSHLVIPFDYQCVGEGRFLATYIPRNAGLHYISILSHGNHIPGSPFEVKVSDWVSSWNLVPKARVVPFDMINNYVEGGSKDGAKSVDKFKLSSVASVSRQLTTMRRRILKKVITQGGREIIVKQSGDIAMGSPSRQSEETSCDRVGGTGGLKLSTIDEKCRTHHDVNGEMKDEGKGSHPAAGVFNTNKYCIGHSHGSSSNGNKPPLSTGPTSTTNSISVGAERNNENLMDDFKNVKMDISDRWKIAALKVSINEMANKCDESLSLSKSTVRDEMPRSTSVTPHSISIKITHCDSKESIGSPKHSTTPYSCKEKHNENVDASSPELLNEKDHDKVRDQHTDHSNPSSTNTSNDGVVRQVQGVTNEDTGQCEVSGLNNLSQTELDSLLDGKYQASKEDSGYRNKKGVENVNKNSDHSKIKQPNIETTVDPSSESSKPQRFIGKEENEFSNKKWSHLRKNYLNYLQNFNRKDNINNSQICQTCNKKFPTDCTCCVDSGNESNPYCEETDGEECSLFSFNVDNVTESSIDSAMGPFQNYFNPQVKDQADRANWNDKEVSRLSNRPQDLENEPCSFISFRKENDNSDLDSAISSQDVNLIDNAGWKTLRKAQSLSDDFNENGYRKNTRLYRGSQSFDSGQIDESCTFTERQDAFIFDQFDNFDTEEKEQRKDIDRGCMKGDITKPKKIPEEAHRVSIVKNSKMVKSIFYIKAKLDDKTFRSYSLPEQYDDSSPYHEDDSELENIWNSGKSATTKKADRFALVKKAWKSFDDDILDLLNNSKEYIDLNKNSSNQAIAKKCAEISLKLANESTDSCISNIPDGAENEEILEVVIENSDVSDGFATENDDEESFVPMTPTSIRIESGLSSMKNSPVSETMGRDGLPCPECLETMHDARMTLGISPLSAEMNKSDNSDWSDDIAPELTKVNTRKEARVVRNYSPQIMDLPRFTASRSPSTSPAIPLAPSFSFHTSSQIHPSPSKRYCSNEVPERYNYTAKPAAFKGLSRKPSHDSDILTEDSSISGSVSGEDNARDVCSFIEIPRSDPGLFTKEKLKTTKITPKATPKTPAMSSALPLQPTPKTLNGSEKGLHGENAGASSTPVNCLNYRNLNGRLIQGDREAKRGGELNNISMPGSKKHCHCSCLNDNNPHTHLLPKRHGIRNDIARYQYGKPLFPLPEIDDGPNEFVEKEIIPTKYKGIPQQQDDEIQRKRSPYQKEFYWDSRAEDTIFVEKILTPTKYRKKNKTYVSYSGENNAKTLGAASQGIIDANQFSYSTPRNQSDSFILNTDSAFHGLNKSDLKDTGTGSWHSAGLDRDNLLWDNLFRNSTEKDIGFIHFMYEMLKNRDGGDFVH